MGQIAPDTNAADDGTPIESGAHAGAILDAALDAVITIDHLGHVREFNRAAETSFGYTKAEALGRELATLIVPPEFRDAHRRALARWTEQGPGPGAGNLLGRRIEVRALRKDGSEFPAELAVTRVDLPGPPLFTACIRDVSERRHAEFQYRTLVEQLPLISYVDSPDSPVSKPIYLSPQVENVIGYTPDQWLATPGLYVESIHPEDRDRVLAEKSAAYERGEALRSEYRMLAADGRIVWVEDQSVLVRPPDGGPPFRQGFAIDVTDRKRAEAALQNAETRFRTLVEQLPLAVYVDAVDASSSNIYTSPQVEQMLGYPPAEWASDPLLFVRTLHPDDRERVLAAHERTHRTGEPLSIVYRLIAKDGRVVWVHDEAKIVDGAGGEPVLQGYLLDVTSRVEAEEQLRHQAFHDPLTGLANRALLTDRVEHALARAGGEPSAAVLFLDLDDFKAVNDRLGHPSGDALLCQAATRLRAALSPGHTVARLGGDEFAVLVEDVREPAAVAELAERLVRGLEAPFEVFGHEIFVTASVGIALGGDAEELLRSADVAMYRAKAAGKAQYAFYVPTMDEEVLGRLELIADLRRAHFDEELVLHYQPTVELASGRVVGVEALLRWNHPVRGLQAPSEFIAAAEETGLIVAIGQWVLRDACRQAAGWRSELQAAAGLQLSVNVSGRQLQHPDLVEDVRGALAASALDPGALTLEITESVLAERGAEVAETLEGIRKLGVRVALDDFGTGYSSLSLLRHLPVDALKIDRAFVNEIGAGADRPALLQAIIGIGRALDLTVVAEGIETATEAATLRRVGCRLGQGFYFARPLDRESLRRYLSVKATTASAIAAA
jgi:diguanylate cyclase (GGDEF)-like protein/PAS domain S-box-containing protein